MFTPLAKLAIGLSATMATAFYYLAAAPPASAKTDVCRTGNFSSACGGGQGRSQQSSPATSSPASLRNPTVLEAPVVAPSPPESPVPLVVDPVQQEPPQPPPSPVPQVVAPPPPESGLVPEPPPIVSPVPQVVDPPPIVSPEPLWVDPAVESAPAPLAPMIRLSPVTEPQAAPALNFTNIYIAPTPVRTTAIPEPGTVVALLLTGAGIICSARKRNKQVGQQR